MVGHNFIPNELFYRNSIDYGRLMKKERSRGTFVESILLHKLYPDFNTITFLSVLRNVIHIFL